MATKYVVTGDQYRIIDRKMREIKRQLDQKSGSPLNPEKVAKALQNLQTIIEGEKPDNVFPITVDCNRSLAKMIEAGKYDWVNSSINPKHFPLKGKGKHELSVTLFHFDRYIESDNAIAEMDKQGYRLGHIEELLALGKKYPNLQKKFSIVALGSVWRDLDGDRHVPYLYWSGSERHLCLRYFSRDWLAARRWYAHARFLSVPK